MDERLFGELSKHVAQADTRRAMVRILAAGVAAAVMGALGRAEPADAAFGYCHPPGAQCSRDKKCCSGKCKSDGTCGCNNKGAPCINRVGIVCCSQQCRKGKCR